MPAPLVAALTAAIPVINNIISSVSAPVVGAITTHGPGLAMRGARESFNIMNSLNFGNVAKVLTLDFKSNTKHAEMGFDQFASKLTSKFLVSGLELSSLRASLDEINRQFSNAMQEQGLSFASENLALQNQVGSLFSVLKDGSLDAGAAMAANIRMSLGEVSKEVGSTTDDINSIMELIPVTSKRALDSLGMSMNDFSSKALRLQTNVRVGLGENASEFLNKALSGEADVQSMKNDKTGIGQLIYNRFGILPFSALAPEQRTQMVARIVNDEDFQQQLEQMANKSGGFELIFRRLSNTLFDSHTGVFGVLREITIEFENFAGETIQSTTSIFNEITELSRTIFDPQDGFFATVLRVFGEAFGFDGDTALKVIVRLLRFFRDGIGKLTELVQTDPIKDFVKGLAGVFKVLGTIGEMIWSMLSRGGLTQKQMDALQGGIDKIIPAISDKIIPFFTDFVNKVGDRIRDILKSIIYISSTITFDGSGLLKAIGGFVNALLTQISVIVPLALQALVVGFQSLVKNFGGYANLKEGFLNFVRALSSTINTILDSLHALVIAPMGQAIKSTEFTDFFKELGTIIGPTIAKFLDTWVNFFLIQRESILLALINMMTPELKNSITQNMKKLIDFFVYFTGELFKTLLTTIVPLMLEGIKQLVDSIIKPEMGMGAGLISPIIDGIIKIVEPIIDWSTQDEDYQTITPPNFQLTPPGGNYTNKASGNFFDAVALERGQSSVFAQPVIANSEEIIIPKGRIQELNTNIETRVVSALAPAFNSIAFEQTNNSDSDFKSFIIKTLSAIDTNLRPKPMQAAHPPNQQQTKPIHQVSTSETKEQKVSQYYSAISNILNDLKQQTISHKQESNSTNVLNLIKDIKQQSNVSKHESNSTNVLNLIKDIKQQSNVSKHESNSTNVLNLIKDIKQQSNVSKHESKNDNYFIVNALKDFKQQTTLEKVSIFNKLVATKEQPEKEEEFVSSQVIHAPTTKDALQLSELSKNSRNSTSLVDHLANVIKVIGKIDENTKNTQKELVISNLLRARPPAPTQQVNVQANIPAIDVSTPDFQSKVVETIKETVVKKQSESIFDKLFGLVGISKPKEPPKISLPTPAPTPTSTVTSGGLDKPIQIILQIDGRTITDVVLKEINSRVTQVNSTP